VGVQGRKGRVTVCSRLGVKEKKVSDLKSRIKHNERRIEVAHLTYFSQDFFRLYTRNSLERLSLVG